MQVLHGKQNLGSYRDIPLMVDWDDLTYFRGELKRQLKMEYMLASVLRMIGFPAIGGSILLTLLGGGIGRVNFLNPNSLIPILFWIGVLTLIYAAYLRRDRQEFNFNLENPDLFDLNKRFLKGKLKEVEVDTYLDYQIFSVIDELYVKSDRDFMTEFSKVIFTDQEVKMLCSRLGIEQGKFLTIVLQVWQGIDASFASNFPKLLPAVLIKALSLEKTRIDATAFFLCLAETVWQAQLLQLGVKPAELNAAQLWLRNQNRKALYLRLWSERSIIKPKGSVNRAYTSRYAPMLQEYGEDYTRQAALGQFTLSIGREQQLLDLIKILQKDSGSAAVLIGDPGVGKTRFLKHLAVRMVVEDVPPVLQDKRLVAFDFNRAYAQNQSLENFKSVIEQVLSEVADSKDIVLVLDDFDQMLHIRADFQSEVENLLVNMIDKYKLRVVATASVEGYQRYIKPVRSLASLMQPIVLTEPEPLIALQVLIDEVPRLESKYGVHVQIEALKQVIDLAPKFAYERVMPDKAIDLLEESILEARDQQSNYLSPDIVDTVVSRKVGVKVGQLDKQESEMLLKLESVMQQRVIGQDAAIKSIAAALRRVRAGLQRGTRPIASFLFFGPTGVGKTEVAKTLAATYYGDEKLMHRIDMSEYHEEQNLPRLIGYTDGDKFVGGYLTEAVRSKPFSLLLLDEIEKANPKVLDLFLQILDEGFITDGAGRKVDFSNVIIIATSNAGSRQIAEAVGEGMKYDQVYERVFPMLREVFRVEFLNRFDKTIMFKPLLPIEVEQIVGLMLTKVKAKLLEQGIGLEYGPQTVNDLAKLSYNPMYGAREAARVIQEQVEDRVAEEIVRGNLVSGKKISFGSLKEYEVS